MRQAEAAFLGSEEDLLARYQISRQTLRQAARVLENEQLLRVQRGVGGGYYVRRPTIEAIGRAAATYLRIRQITLEDIVEVGQLIDPTVVRKAALSEDEATRKELSDLVETIGNNIGGPAEFISWDNQVYKLIARLAGNPALELLTSVFAQIGFETPQQTVYANQPGRMAQWLIHRRKVAAAILDRDPEVAALYVSRGSKIFKDWLAEDRRALAPS